MYITCSENPLIQGITALGFVAAWRYGSEELVNILIDEFRASVDQMTWLPGNELVTPFMQAVLEGHYDVATAFFKKGAQINEVRRRNRA